MTILPARRSSSAAGIGSEKGAAASVCGDSSSPADGPVEVGSLMLGSKPSVRTAGAVPAGVLSTFLEVTRADESHPLSRGEQDASQIEAISRPEQCQTTASGLETR
jgi:hypothetical protein